VESGISNYYLVGRRRQSLTDCGEARRLEIDLGIRRAKKCYRCDADGVTREHVPPFSFFPEDFRINLWTVRSCEEHNISNSQDVEYVRNIIVSHRNATGTAHRLVQSTSFRSFERSAALFLQTFREVTPIIVDGEEAAVFRLDLPRFRRVIEAIAYAIYYRDNGRTYAGGWRIFSPTLLSANDIRGVPDNWQALRDIVRTIPITPLPTPVPEVFRYGIHMWEEGHFAYAFEFYGGFQVFVWTKLHEST
jgi:hypothetical protein